MLAIDQVYTIKIGAYPWTDAFAKANSTPQATLLEEAKAKQLLDGQGIKITTLTPPLEPFHRGDKGLVCTWVKGRLISGPIKGESLAVFEDWLLPPSTTPSPSNCVCPMNTILAKGCQCGGA